MSELASATAGGAGEPAAIRRVRIVAYLLDDAIRVPGTNYRVGLDPLVGVVPGLGDAATTLVSLYIVLEAVLADAPPRVLARMVAVVAVDAVFGSIPLVGTLFDAVWKANARNARLLADHLDAPADPTDRRIGGG